MNPEATDADIILAMIKGLNDQKNATVDQLLAIGDEYRDLFFELRDRITAYAGECDSRQVSDDLLHILDTLGRIAPAKNY
ncbi:hypothetical protein ACFYY5_29270 [Nocardia elegans]|uniref:Uncharacterized protein n=1 Tax=Nocardia elegans TaxID=300029 RepID=A0ABW6TQJ0_9NOCA